MFENMLKCHFHVFLVCPSLDPLSHFILIFVLIRELVKEIPHKQYIFISTTQQLSLVSIFLVSITINPLKINIIMQHPPISVTENKALDTLLGRKT